MGFALVTRVTGQDFYAFFYNLYVIIELCTYTIFILFEVPA